MGTACAAGVHQGSDMCELHSSSSGVRPCSDQIWTRCKPGGRRARSPPTRFQGRAHRLRPAAAAAVSCGRARPTGTKRSVALALLSEPAPCHQHLRQRAMERWQYHYSHPVLAIKGPAFWVSQTGRLRNTLCTGVACTRAATG